MSSNISFANGTQYDATTIQHKAIGTIGQLTHNPFGNCQIFSISQFQYILGFTEKESIDSLLEIHKQNGKTELIIDIRETLCTKLENLFKEEEIIFKSPYKNNTGSKMCIYLLQIKHFSDRIKRERLEESTKAKAAAKVKVVKEKVVA